MSCGDFNENLKDYIRPGINGVYIFARPMVKLLCTLVQCYSVQNRLSGFGAQHFRVALVFNLTLNDFEPKCGDSIFWKKVVISFCT